mmetsp:Transcript_44092/g.143091  ORF Transcript_44092/g.143091 Transcript_44092/m.143091 type:complete len:430 (-) Transcript_44092:96-1385(-)
MHRRMHRRMLPRRRRRSSNSGRAGCTEAHAPLAIVVDGAARGEAEAAPVGQCGRRQPAQRKVASALPPRRARRARSAAGAWYPQGRQPGRHVLPARAAERVRVAESSGAPNERRGRRPRRRGGAVAPRRRADPRWGRGLLLHRQRRRGRRVEELAQHRRAQLVERRLGAAGGDERVEQVVERVRADSAGQCARQPISAAVRPRQAARSDARLPRVGGVGGRPAVGHPVAHRQPRQRREGGRGAAAAAHAIAPAAATAPRRAVRSGGGGGPISGGARRGGARSVRLGRPGGGCVTWLRRRLVDGFPHEQRAAEKGGRVAARVNVREQRPHRRLLLEVDEAVARRGAAAFHLDLDRADDAPLREGRAQLSLVIERRRRQRSDPHARAQLGRPRTRVVLAASRRGRPAPVPLPLPVGGQGTAVAAAAVGRRL